MIGMVKYLYCHSIYNILDVWIICSLQSRSLCRLQPDTNAYGCTAVGMDHPEICLSCRLPAEALRYGRADMGSENASLSF